MGEADEETAAAVQPAPPGTVAPGTVLNGIYRIEEQLGQGGMGEVWRATNINNDEQDAIKIIGRARGDQTRADKLFRKEARVLGSIESSAVARLKLFARDPALDLLYFVTEFVRGESLLARLKRQPASAAELRALLRRVLTGLQAVHDAGAVHRDLSPDNIILPDGEVARAKIIDFGIAKELDPTQTTHVGDLFAGKLGYVAAEQLGFSGSEVGPWSDLYSLGLVGIAFAQGRPLDMGAVVGTADERRRQLSDQMLVALGRTARHAHIEQRQLIDLSLIPADLLPVFSRLLTYDWRERAHSAGEVLALIDGRGAGPDPGPPPPPPPPSPPAEDEAPPARARSILPIVLGGGALIGFAVATGGWFSYQAAPPAGQGARPPAARSSPAVSAAAPGSWMKGKWAVDKATNGCSFALTIDVSRDGRQLVFTGAAGATQRLPFHPVAGPRPTVATADYRYVLIRPGHIVGTSLKGEPTRTFDPCDG